MSHNTRDYHARGARGKSRNSSEDRNRSRDRQPALYEALERESVNLQHCRTTRQASISGNDAVQSERSLPFEKQHLAVAFYTSRPRENYTFNTFIAIPSHSARHLRQFVYRFGRGRISLRAHYRCHRTACTELQRTYDEGSLEDSPDHRASRKHERKYAHIQRPRRRERRQER